MKVNRCMMDMDTVARVHLRRLILRVLKRIYIAYCRVLQRCCKSMIEEFRNLGIRMTQYLQFLNT